MQSQIKPEYYPKERGYSGLLLGVFIHTVLTVENLNPVLHDPILDAIYK